MQSEQSCAGELREAYRTAQGDAVQRAAAERARLQRGGYRRSRAHLRLLRRQLDDVLFPLPAPATSAPVADDETAHFFHDIRNNLQAAILAATGLARDLPPARRERYLDALRLSLTNIVEDLQVLDPAEPPASVSAPPTLALVPTLAPHEGETRTGG